MMKHLSFATLRVAILPLVSVCGTIFVLLLPDIHRAFCAGLPGLA